LCCQFFARLGRGGDGDVAEIFGQGDFGTLFAGLVSGGRSLDRLVSGAVGRSGVLVDVLLFKGCAASGG
jgi:hypothetical protein